MIRLSNETDVERLFGCRIGPRGGHAYNFARVVYCLQHGILDLTEHPYRRVPPPNSDEYAELTVFEYANRGSGGSSHRLLRWWAWNWCVTTLLEPPVFEYACEDAVIDAAALKHRIMIECKITPPRRAFSYYYQVDADNEIKEQWTSFVLFPGNDSGLLYQFHPTVAGQAVLQRYARWDCEWKQYMSHRDYVATRRSMGDEVPFPNEPLDPGEPFNLGFKESGWILDRRCK